jgi:DNA invertase Pin-like site-specific DNA recombinase
MIIGYLRVSTAGQFAENQRLAILEFCNREKMGVDSWIEVTASSRKDTTVRRIDELMDRCAEGDTIVVAELSRLGRSVGQIVILIQTLVDRNIGLICIKEGIRLGVDKMDMSTKVMITMFSLLGEIERDLISERTKEGLTRARACGKKIGRPPGAYSSKLDGFEAEIIGKLQAGVSKVRVGTDYGTSPGNLRDWLKKKGYDGHGKKIE